ncbi:cilia- and flagella-associated protein 263 isoform X4 [Anas platyrhynchos]|uniref:cilia- and flagella-associated protein 263 isoform X4 n=1 Tax=Anas platyrhynchos TaxID=8839 RepID=UPI003AF2BD64
MCWGLLLCVLGPPCAFDPASHPSVRVPPLPQHSHGGAGAGGAAPAAAAGSPAGGATHGRAKSKMRRSTGYFAGLTVEQKCELAERELVDMKGEIQRMEEDTEKTLHDIEAVIQETDIWWTDVKKAISEFEKDIVSTISNKKGSIIASEKLLRYLEEKNHQRVSAAGQKLSLVCHLKCMDLMKEKLRLENSFLKGYKKKLQQQLRQKEQMGDTLRGVHSQQLQVTKEQYEEKIEQKNEELQQLKLTLGKTVQILNFRKKKLQNTMETSTSLMKDISQRMELLEKIERETTLVEEQRAKAKSLDRWLQKQLSDYSTPPVMSYVQTAMAVTDLEKSIKAWQRRAEIAEMTLQGYRRAWNQVKMSGNQQLAEGAAPFF